MTSCISYIMTLHTANVLPFSGKGQSKDGYHQPVQVPVLIPVASQEKYLWTTDCRLIPVTSQENYLHEEIED